jgi:hypothetical protein
MLKVIMRLEQCIPGEELHKDAPNTPDITSVAPAKVEDDLWCPIMPC